MKSLRISDAKKFFLFILIFLLLTDLVILLNIPILRQVLGFLFFTIVPGLLILHILRLNRIGLTERIMLSVGLSVAFLMFYGLLINGISLALGYAMPLSTTSLLTSFSVAIVILLVTAYIRTKDITLLPSDFRLTRREKALLVVPSLFPLLSILGTHLMNSKDNNALLMLLLILIPAYVIFISFFNRRVPEKVYPISLFLVSISLLLMFSLRSNHIIIGSDTGREYYLFQVLLTDLHWSMSGLGNLDSCLSISLLPGVYQSFLSISPEYLFKLLYSLLFAISPLAIYILSKKYIGGFYAFLASVFFMSQATFLITPSVARINIAVLFWALATMTLFHDNISRFSKRLLLIIFSASIIVSHYGTAYIFLFVLLLTWIAMQILPRLSLHRKKLAGGLNVSQSQSQKGITITIVVVFFAMLFLWYSQVIEAPFTSGVRFISNSVASLTDFFAIEARGSDITILLGEGITLKGILAQVRFVITWMSFALIAIGVLSMLLRHRGKTGIPPPQRGNSKAELPGTKVEMEYLAMALACSIVLVATLAFPYASQTQSLFRAYLPIVIVLSTCFIIGSIASSHTLHIKMPFLLILLVLVPYFMCNTGSLDQIVGEPTMITLNSEGSSYNTSYIHDQDSYAAKWLARYAKRGETIYTSGHGVEILTSQGKIPPAQISSLIPAYEECGEIGEYIYLRYYHVIEGEILVWYSNPWRLEIHNMSEYPDMFTYKNKIYANGGSEVWR